MTSLTLPAEAGAQQSPIPLPPCPHRKSWGRWRQWALPPRARTARLGGPNALQREGPAAAPQICPRPPRGSARPAPTAVLSTNLGLGDQQQPWYNFKDNIFYSFILRKRLHVISDAVAVADPIHVGFSGRRERPQNHRLISTMRNQERTPVWAPH